MSTTDWEERYRTGDMPWEKGEPVPGLVDFLAEHPELPRGTVAVPGCGSGHDVRAWARAGFAAHGFDLAPSAIRLCREKTEAAGLTAEFSQVDFLAVDPPQPFDWLFEHTLFCAIDPSYRDEYVKAVLRWLKPGGQFLAVHYLIPDVEGPPFGTTCEEILRRFSPHLELRQDWVPRSYPNRTGLERMFWWRRAVTAVERQRHRVTVEYRVPEKAGPSNRSPSGSGYYSFRRQVVPALSVPPLCPQCLCGSFPVVACLFPLCS